MFKNYLKIAFRNLGRNKGFTFINIVGLSLGMAVCILIMLWVVDEYSFDRHHESKDNIYRVVFSYLANGETRQHWRTPPPLAGAILERYPEVKSATRFYNEGSVLLSNGENKIKAQPGFSDPSIFNIFTYPLSKGNNENLLQDPESIVLTTEMANILFPDENPVGKNISLNNEIELRVDGVLQSVPENTNLQFDFLLAFSRMPEIFGYGGEDDWGDYGFNTFLLIEDAEMAEGLPQKINTFMDELMPELGRAFYLQPLLKIHLYRLDGSPGMIRYVYIFTSIALFILLIACINFTNLSAAKSMSRLQEIGVRKVLGAGRNQLRSQFLSESVIMALLAMILAVVMVELLITPFGNLAGKELVFNFLHPVMLVLIIVIAIITGLFSGVYPAFLLSSFKILSLFKGNSKKRSSIFQKSLVVLQFGLSVILIFATLTVSDQIKFLQSNDLGFDKTNVIYLPTNSQYAAKSETLKEQLKNHKDIESVTFTSSHLGLGPKWSTSVEQWEGNAGEQTLNLPLISCDKDFLDVFDIQLVEGSFHQDNAYEEGDVFGYVLNETAVKMAGLDSPIGKRFNDGEVIGVVKDFHFRSLHNKIQPLALLAIPEWNNYVSIKVRGNNLPGIIGYIEEVSNEIAPGFIFEYHFLDDRLESSYRAEMRLGRIFSYFAILAVIISCLGLLGLSSFIIKQRTKEIGIRKVLGSSVLEIVKLLSTSFTRWVIIANMIALPIAYYLMHNWLRNFAYKTSLGIETYIITAAMTILIALITISIETVRAANANPVDSLKCEM